MSRTARTKTKTKRALLRIDGEPVELVVRANPRARRFIVKVDPATGQVSVVAPSSRSLDKAIDFAREEREWIAGRLANVPKAVPLALGNKLLYRGTLHLLREGRGKHPVWVDSSADEPTIRVHGRAEHATRRVQDWLKREARKKITERVWQYATEMEVKPKRIQIRDTTSRWGSCSTEKTLSFCWRLILAPPHILDYVVAHEVCHLRELNHRPRFWKLVDHLVDHSERSQRWLAENGATLHRYAPKARAN